MIPKTSNRNNWPHLLCLSSENRTELVPVFSAKNSPVVEESLEGTSMMLLYTLPLLHLLREEMLSKSSKPQRANIFWEPFTSCSNLHQTRAENGGGGVKRDALIGSSRSPCFLICTEESSGTAVNLGHRTLVFIAMVFCTRMTTSHPCRLFPRSWKCRLIPLMMQQQRSWSFIVWLNATTTSFFI